MIELERSGFYRVEPLFSDIKHCVSLNGAIEALHPARIFVDDSHNPQAAIVYSQWGYTYLGGKPGESFIADLREKLRQDLASPNPAMFFILAQDALCHKVLNEVLPPPQPISISRLTFAFNSERFQAMRQELPPLPPEYQLLPFGDLPDDEVKPAVMATWRSLDTFRERGIGFAVRHTDRVVAMCYSAFVARQAAEIEIFTDVEYRRRGLATHAATAFISECQRRKLRLNWECFANNEASINLAEKLGFTAQGEYPVYYWSPDL